MAPANIPSLPPKKQRSSAGGGGGSATTTATTRCNVEHDYDEYCAKQQHQFESKQQRQAARAALERLSSLTIGSSSNKHHHQGRSATFDLEDARDFELQRLGHRRSQQQQQLQLQLQLQQHSKQSLSAGNTTFSGSVGNSLGKHRGETRTHDRERSRSDHRIASYVCDDPAFCRLLPNGNMASSQQQQHHHQQQQQPQQQPTAQQLLLQRQQRREKTFKV